MSIQKVSYRKWDRAYEVVSEDKRLVLVADIGPRILSLTRGDGPNLLFEDVDEDFVLHGWKIYGGHRLWVSPETMSTFLPDNDPCEVRIDGDGADAALVVNGPPAEATGIEKTLIIHPAPGGFRIKHILKNTAPALAPPGGCWALTCVRPTGVCAIPWVCGNDQWRVANIKYWQSWGETVADVESPQWKPTRDLFEVHPTGETGKVGGFVEAGWIGQWTDEATFIKQFPVQPGATYPDGGCSVELYTCDRFIELETLGPTVVLEPGQSVEHEERWFVSAPIERTLASVASVIGP